MKNWKRIMALGMGLSMLFLTACGSTNQEATEGNGGEATQSASEGGTLIVGMASDLQTLDPGNGYEIYGNMMYYALYDNLFRAYGDSKPVPSLAESYELDEEQTTYTFKLREDVKFSSGNPFTSADVAFSINRTRNLKGNTSHHTSKIVSIETPDDYTVVITLEEPDASFLAKLANNSFAILDAEVVRANGGTDAEDAATTDTAQAWLDQNSAGSGAYVLESWTPNVEVVLDRNTEYWGEVKNDRVICKEIPDVNTQIQMLLMGDIDIALGVGADTAVQLEGQDGVDLYYAPGNTITFLMMNQDPEIGGPMSDPRVQEAVRYAINYEELLQLTGDNSMLPMNIVPDGFIGALQKDAASSMDLDKARALLAEAGYPDGFDVPFTVATFNTEGTSWTTLGQKIKDDLSKVGINAEIITSEVGVVIDSYREGKEQFLLMHWSPDYPDINNQLAFLPGNTVGLRANWTDTSNEALEAAKRTVMTEGDDSIRAAAAEDLQRLLAEEMPYAFLVQHPKVIGYSTNIEGIHYYEVQKINFQDIALK